MDVEPYKICKVSDLLKNASADLQRLFLVKETAAAFLQDLADRHSAYIGKEKILHIYFYSKSGYDDFMLLYMKDGN